jgi:hypothetical protein
LVQCAFKLVPPTPLIPTAKVKRCMFIFILNVLNDARPSQDFFGSTSAPPRCPCRRTCKPRGSGLDPPAVDRQASPPLGAMDLDPPCTAGGHRPVELSGPSGLASLPSALVVEEQDPAAVYSALASTSVRPLGFPPPSAPSVPSGLPIPRSPSPKLDLSTLNAVVAQALSPGGAFRPPSPASSVIGKHSWSSSPSPPESSASHSAPPGFVYIPTSPPPPVGTKSSRMAPDWREWIWAHRLASSGRSWVIMKELVTRQGDLDDAAVELAAALGQLPSSSLPLPSDWDDKAPL